MLIGIISDTHDRLTRTEIALQSLTEAGCEAIIHCGDLTSPEIAALCGRLPCYFVFGNNDDDGDPALARAMNSGQGICLGWSNEIRLANKRIAVTHGHRYNDMQRLLASRPEYFLYGHTHVAADQRQLTTRLINPGALHRASSFSVATLNLTTDKLQFIAVPR